MKFPHVDGKKVWLTLAGMKHRINNLNNRRKIASIGLLAVLIAVNALVFWVMAGNSFPVINPPPSKVFIPMTLIYPTSALVGEVLPNRGVAVSFVLTANSTIAEGTNIIASNAIGQTLESNGGYTNSTRVVQVGFQEALWSKYRTSIQEGAFYRFGFAGIIFNRTSIPNDTKLIPYYYNPFYFPAAGDYSPTIHIEFYNGTAIQYTYSEIKIHVLSDSELKSQNLERISAVLTVALTLFADMEASKIVYDILTTTEDNTSQTPSDTQEGNMPKPPQKVRKPREIDLLKLRVLSENLHTTNLALIGTFSLIVTSIFTLTAAQNFGNGVPIQQISAIIGATAFAILGFVLLIFSWSTSRRKKEALSEWTKHVEDGWVITYTVNELLEENKRPKDIQSGP